VQKLTGRLEILYHDHFKEIYRYVYYHVHNPSEAEDVTQDIFVKALQGLSTFEDRASARTWMFTIARRAVVDWSRRAKVRKVVNVDDVPEIIADIDLEGDFEERERTGILVQALRHLPDTYREVIVLRIIQGMSIDEVSQILDWSQSKVKVTLHRSLKKLRKDLTENRSFIHYIEGGVADGRKAK